MKTAIQALAHPELSLTNSKWDEVKKLFEMLSYPFLATKRMQATNLTPGAFLKEWKTLIFIFDRAEEKLLMQSRTLMNQKEKR